MKLVEYPDAGTMMSDLAQKLGDELKAALQRQERVSLAVPGGTTPGPIFDVLCDVDLPWDRVDIMLTDERWVPESSERSNTRLLRARLLQKKAAAATLVPLYADTETPEDALGALGARVAEALPLSVVVLGMGADMHTASIFPGADKLTEALTGDDMLYPMRAPGAPEPRITLSAKALKTAVSLHVLIKGPEKRTALEKAQTLSPAEAPVAAILDQATVHWTEA